MHLTYPVMNKNTTNNIDAGTPLVSVLMPCFNHHKYVSQALDSLVESSYERLELIFIDDASRDESFEIASSWINAYGGRFERVVFEQHEVNRGITATLNELVFKAKGEYLTFVASDDMLVADGIRKQVLFAQEKEIGYVFADAQLIDEEGGIIAPSALKYFDRTPKAMERKNWLALDVVLNWEIPWTRMFVRKDLLLQLGAFDESMLFEDRDFVVRVLISGSYAFIPETVYVYRLRRNNRITPGLDPIKMRSDYQVSELNNFKRAKGFLKILLGLSVFSRKNLFNKRGNLLNSITWPYCALARRIVFWIHIAAMRIVR